MNSGSFGSHNSFADLVPISLIIFGDILWLPTTILQPQRLIPKKNGGKVDQKLPYLLFRYPRMNHLQLNHPYSAS